MGMIFGDHEEGFFGAEGQTIGKKIMGIRTVMNDDGEFGDMGLSHFVWDIAGRQFLGFDFLYGLFFSSKNQCLHNKLAGTIVIQYP